MLCPKCVSHEMKENLGRGGILIDVCAHCGGYWLDKGEIYHYVKNPNKLYKLLLEAYKRTVPTHRICPRCPGKKHMVQAKIPGSRLLIDICPSCGGTWFDKGEIQNLTQILSRKVGEEALETPHEAAQAPEEASPVPDKSAALASGATVAAARLTALPSMAFRSWTVLISLYGILVAFAWALTVYFKMNIEYMFLFAAIGIILNFILAPFIMDITLKWLYKFKRVKPEDLPEHLWKFILSISRENRIPFPRCGIIEDGNPNAFTYGHVPGNARLVLTTGVMDMLDEKELEAVAGHEMGHILHWDMLVMTVAAIVPTVLYLIYRVTLRAGSGRRRSSGSGKGGGAVAAIGVAALILYIITEYIVLFLSRVREYYADRFSGQVTRNPNSLTSALVKIAYGLAGRRKSTKEEEKTGAGAPGVARALGIFDPTSAKSLVAASLTRGKDTETNILGAMQWDLWNPWAKYYEIHSTHPLPAHRIDMLGKQAASYGQKPMINFNLKKPESYWDEFLVDILMQWLPVLLAAAAAGLSLLHFGPGIHAMVPTVANTLAALGAGSLLKIRFSYKAGFFPDMYVSSLLKRVKVSKIRSVPATLRGKIIGKGVPGFLISEDMVLQDDTGFIFLDYRQPLAIFNWIFALRRVNRMIGREVTARGWYRRAPVPFFELQSVTCEGRTHKCFVRSVKVIFAFLMLVLSVLIGCYQWF